MLPPYSSRLAGPHEIVIHNAFPAAALVGIRGGSGSGVNVALRANESKSAFVPAGDYWAYWFTLDDSTNMRTDLLVVPGTSALTSAPDTEDNDTNFLLRPASPAE